MTPENTASGVGEITKAFGQVQFCPLRKCQYVHETIQLSSQMTNMAVQTIVKNLLANRKPYELYKIFLTGTLNADTELDLDWIRNQEAVVDVICRCGRTMIMTGCGKKTSNSC